MQAVDVKTHDVFMPALSSTMTEGRVVQWLKQPGDRVDVGEPIMVVESDKADMDVESFEAGFLASVLVEEGETAEVGATVAWIVENEEDVGKVGKGKASVEKKPEKVEQPKAQVKTEVKPQVAPEKPKMGEIFMPALSSTMTEGKVVEWLKSEGDAISSGDNVMVVESDKADMDVESFENGYLAYIAVDEGESCPVGDPVGYLALEEADIEKVKAWALGNKGSAQPAVVEEKQQVKAVEEPAPVEKKIQAVVVNEGRIIASPRAKIVAAEKGIDLKFVQGTGPGGRIVESDVLQAKEKGVRGDVESKTAASAVVPAGVLIATPEAKKIAKKEKIDLETIKGTGKFGRITAQDVLRAAGKEVEVEVKQEVKAVEKKEVAKKEKPVELVGGAVAMNALQKAVVQNMNKSLDVPVFRITYKIKTGALDELYAKTKPKGVTMSALLAKAVGMTLLKHPLLNSEFRDNSIIYKEDINVAMAVAMKDGGLITPTLKNVDKTDLYSLSRDWKDLVKRAMDKKLSVDEYSSGTFMVSNLGMYGVEQFDAILPPGVSGILAIGASKPVVGLQKNGLVGVEKEMSVTLTADHRNVYGAHGASFLKDLKSLLENDVMELLL